MNTPDGAENQKGLAQMTARELAVILRQRLDRHPTCRTLEDVAALTGVPKKSLEKFFTGYRSPSKANLRKLLPFLGSTFAGKGEPAVRDAERDDRAATPGQATEAADRVYSLMRQLDHALEFFKRGSKTDRDVLRRRIQGRDVGYLTGLLRALYDETEFESWLFYATYKIGDGPNR